MAWYVPPDSIVRRIWGDPDVILFVFSGGAAEFALNRAVDWLFFTGKLPSDPVGRFFSTVAYAQKIVFADQLQAERTLARIYSIHEGVEQARGARIPAWAYRDVLYMLIDYSERAYQLLHRPLTPDERNELFEVFRRVGIALQLEELPPDYDAWQLDRRRHLERDLVFSQHTMELCAAYRRDLGAWRYTLLRHVQAMLAPAKVHKLLNLPKIAWLRPALSLYRLISRLGLRSLVQRSLFPPQHFAAVQRLHST